MHIFTSRNEVVAKVISVHLSVILFMGRGVSASVHAGIPPPGSRHPQEQTSARSRHPREQTPPWSRHTPEQTSPGSRHTPWEQTPPGSRHPPGSRLWHTVNERPVRILLECILVVYCAQSKKHVHVNSISLGVKSL